MTLTRKWLLLTAVVVVAILAAGWFLLVAPKRADAAQLRTDAANTAAANESLLQSLAVLKAQQADLPAQRFKLATLKTQMPDDPALPRLIRDLTAASRRVGVTLDSLAPSPPSVMVAPVAAVPVAPPTTEDTSGKTTTDSSSTTSGPEKQADAAAVPTTAVPTGSTLYQVPLAVTVTGSYFELEQFVNRLEGLKRSMQVTGFTVTHADTAGEPTSGKDELTMTLQSRVFISAAAPATAATQPTPVAPATVGE